MGRYPARAVERAMKIQEVILRAVSGQILWMHAAEIIGISDRSMRRWRRRYEELKEVIEQKGMFCSLYSDRGSHFFYTPTAGGAPDRGRQTQIRRATRG
jgi:hypothetical protein